MSVSTNGQINYGIPFEEGFEFPWSIESGDGGDEGDIEAWWRSVNGYEPPCNPYTPDGDYADGFSQDDPRIDEYYEHQSQWMKSHPLPVEVVNYCSGDCPMILLAVPGLGLSCLRGHPEEFDPRSLVAGENERRTLLEFCKQWGIKTDQEPKWYLTSYWG